MPAGEALAPMPAGNILEDAERELIAGALREAKGNASEAARKLGVTRMALRYRIEKHGIRALDYRGG